jgi:phosphohistidine phosphatase SixA
VVIACRHAMTERFDENEMTLRYDDPATQRKLSPRGEWQSDAMGQAFRALHISIGEIIASPMQRARRMAELAFGPPELDSSWHTRGSDYSGPKRVSREDRLTGSVSGGNRLIVSHLGTMQNAIPEIRGEFQEGDCIVLRPASDRRYDVVGVIPWRRWLNAAGMSTEPPR